jgi:hypothetical protein
VILIATGEFILVAGFWTIKFENEGYVGKLEDIGAVELESTPGGVEDNKLQVRLAENALCIEMLILFKCCMSMLTFESTFAS